MRKKVVTFGEIMLRLSTPLHRRFVQSSVFEAMYSGGEANVAVSLAGFGLEAAYVTKIPDNPIGHAAVNYLRQFGVITDYISRGGARLGIYFLESGAVQRPSKVVYDRAGSSISSAKEEDFDWEEIFTGAEWFHWTGITPAISDNAAACVKNACETAKAKGLTISCDLNYRKKLWTKQKANTVMSALIPFVDVCICNEEDASDVFGIAAPESDVNRGAVDLSGYEYVARKLHEQCKLKKVAITLRQSYSASHNGWQALLLDGENCHFSTKYNILPIVDRVGGGDSFGSGLIYSLITGKKPEEAIEFAAAASALKHTIHGDFNLVSVEEVDKLAQGNASGRVER